MTKEVEQSRGNLERNAYDNQQQRNALDHDLARLNEQINETNVINNNLDGELKMAFRNKYEFDQKSKEDKNELEHKIREASYNLEKAQSEN